MGFLDFGHGIVSLTRLCGGFCEFGRGFSGGDWFWVWVSWILAMVVDQILAMGFLDLVVGLCHWSDCVVVFDSGLYMVAVGGCLVWLGFGCGGW